MPKMTKVSKMPKVKDLDHFIKKKHQIGQIPKNKQPVIKHQISKTKLQINSNIQNPMTKLAKFQIPRAKLQINSNIQYPINKIVKFQFSSIKQLKIRLF
jgi:hypothetical protein